jgi:hypothetical protein
MRHQIGGHERDAFRIAHQRLQRGPLRLELFLLRQLLAPRLRDDLLKLASSFGSSAAFRLSLEIRLS